MCCVSIAEFNASATFQFLKACNECLVMTAQAFVPGYPLLDYLLAYGEAVNLSVCLSACFSVWLHIFLSVTVHLVVFWIEHLNVWVACIWFIKLIKCCCCCIVYRSIS